MPPDLIAPDWFPPDNFPQTLIGADPMPVPNFDQLPEAAPKPFSIYFAQFNTHPRAQTLVLDGGGFQTVYYPNWLYADPTEPCVAAYIEGLRVGYAADGASPHLTSEGERYASDVDFRRGYDEAYDIRSCHMVLEDIGRNGWRGAIYIEGEAHEKPVWHDEMGSLVDSIADGEHGENWTPMAGSLAGKIIIALGHDPRFRDLPSAIIARALRHAATYLNPEVPLTDIEPALAFVETVSGIYTEFTENERPISLGLDDLALALDRAEEELVPYIGERARRRDAEAARAGAKADVSEREAA